MIPARDVAWLVLRGWLLGLGVALGIMVAAALLMGCGASSMRLAPDEEMDCPDAGGDLDGGKADAEPDAEPTCDGCLLDGGGCLAYGACDEEALSICSPAGTVVSSCPDGTCDCGEDSDSCPIDCPPAWGGCETGPEVTCDQLCESRGLYCTEGCVAESDGSLRGMEMCDPIRIERPGSCERVFGPPDTARCCCGRES